MNRRFSDNVTWIAEEVSRQVAGGAKRLKVTLPRPSGPTLLLAVSVREQFSRRTWELALMGDGPCRLCRRKVEALRSEGASPLELARLIYRAADVVTSCDCAAAARGQIGGERRGEPRSTPSPRRINILPAASADAAPQPTTGVIKIKPASSVSSPSRGADDVSEVREGAPSFICSLASGVVVGVTLTNQVCHLLARHCDESNRHGREVGGVIAGYSFEAEAVGDRKNIQTVATDIIPVESSDSSGAYLCLSEQDWLYVQRQFDEKYSAQGKVRVGWYHTHPTQTVFFSNMDADAHTVFRQPHQFALVVDPRKMEAGLFYWKDYEKLLHAGPLRFMLEARAEGASAGARSLTLTGAGQPHPRPLSPWRLSLFAGGAAATLIVWTVTAVRVPTLDDINVAALGLLAGLRLWNGGFFHPAQTRASNGRSGAAGLRERLAADADAARDRLGGRSLIALMVILLTLGAVLYLLNRQPAPAGGEMRNTTATLRQAAGEVLSVPGDDVQPKQPTHLLLVSDRIVDGKATRTLTSAGPRSLQVTYVAAPPQNGRAKWDAPRKSESSFFKTVFGLGIEWQRNTTEQKDFQSALGMTEADGFWGQETRAAFLSKAVELRESGGLLVFKIGRDDARVRFLDGRRKPRAAGARAWTDAWWRGAALILALGCAGWATATCLTRACSLAPREVLFLFLLALILYELMQVGRGRRRQ
jgi:proteasome lid subunit RPN8/RPN11